VKQLIFILFFLNTSLANAQKQGQNLIDSLLSVLPVIKDDSTRITIYNSLSYEYRRVDVDEGIRYGSLAAALSKKINWKQGLAEAYRVTGVNYVSVTVLDTALDNLERSLAIFKEIDNLNGIAKVYGTLGNLYNLKGEIPRALEMHLKALSINEDLKDERNIAGNLSNIAVIYFDLGKIKEAIAFLERAVKLNLKYNNKTFLAINYHELSRIYESLNEYDKAFEYSSKAYNTSREIGDKTGMALGREGMGFVYESQQNYSKALEVYASVLAIRKEFDDKLGTTGSLGTIALCYLKMAKEKSADNKRLLDSAYLYAVKGNEVAREIGNLEWQKINYHTLSETQELQGSFEKALASYKTSIVFRDSILNSDKKETIKNLEDKRSIELRDKQIKINELEIANSKKQRWLYMGGITFLVLLGAFLVWQNNSRKRANKKLAFLNKELDQANQTKTRFFGILNHDLRSPVADLVQFLQLQKDAPDLLDEATKARMELQTMTGAENLLQSMEDLLLWSKGQMQHFKPAIKPVAVRTLFDAVERHFYGTQGVEFIFENKDDLFLQTDENYLLTIMRNLTGNAVKALQHISEASITWKASNQDGKAVLSISDNGPGMKGEELKALYDDTEIVGIKSGLGLHLIRDFAKAISCDIDVKTGEGTGTVFTLTVNS
jgi:signal transduction histidine kinase/lipopolysaccharide biosynthesis regulator YciM